MSSIHFTHIPRSLLISILLGILLPSSMAFFTKFPKKIAACLDFPTGTQKNSFVLTTVGLAVILMIFSRTRKTQNKQLQINEATELSRVMNLSSSSLKLGVRD